MLEKKDSYLLFISIIEIRSNSKEYISILRNTTHYQQTYVLLRKIDIT